jgi:hypothetical protein
MANDLKNKPAATPESEKADMLAIIETQGKQIEELRAILMAAIQTQPKISPDTLWAQQHQKEMAIKAKLDEQASYFQQSCKDRTQWQANKVNTEAKRLWKVQVGWCPELIMHANDKTMAMAYYNQLCGIIAVQPNHNQPKLTTYVCVDVTDDPVSQAMAKTAPPAELTAAA